MKTPFQSIGRFSRRAIIAGAGAMLLTGALVAGTALAADPTPTPKPNTHFQQFVTKLAQKLGKTEAEVTGAITSTQQEFIDQAVKDGKLPQAAADRMKERMDDGPMPFGRFPQVGPMGKGRMAVAGWAGNEMADAAKFLGISVADLRTEMQSGKSLEEIAKAKGLDPAKLKTAMLADATKKLDDAVAAGKLTADQKAKRLEQLSSRIDQMMTRKMNQSVKPNGKPDNKPNNGMPGWRGFAPKG